MMYLISAGLSPAFFSPSTIASCAAYPNSVSMRMIPSDVFTAQALFILVVSIYRLSNTWPPSAYQFSFGGVAPGPRPPPRAAPPAAGGAPPRPGPAGEFAVGAGPIVAGHARRAAPVLLEFNNAVAAALCAVA